MPSNYNGKISRNTDWGGDASTGFLPVDGASVQGHIKEEFAGKIGAVYKGNNKVYYFSTPEDKQAFIDTDDESYVIYSYELESDYEIILDEFAQSHSVIKGTTGNSISFRFKIVDKNGLTPDARAKIELSFTGSGVSNRVNNEIPVVANDWTLFTMNIDDLLRDGQNNIAVKITGMSTKTSTQFTMTYNIFDLTFLVNFEYNTEKQGRTMQVPYVIECSDSPKYVEFFIDGERVQVATINDLRYDSVELLDISQLAPGQHSLQVRGSVRGGDGTMFYAPTHFYTFAKAGDAPTSFLMHRESEDGTYVVGNGENLKISLSQFEQIKFDWSIYNVIPRVFTVKFEYDGKIVANSSVNGNGNISTFNYRPMDFGTGKTLSIYALNEDGEKIFNYDIDIDVAETASGIKETVNGLQMKLVARGKRNEDEDKDKWEYEGSDGNLYYAKFSGFTWNAQQGWDEETESLVISNGATVSFFYKGDNDIESPVSPMINDWVRNGGTVEIDLETFDIEDENAVICECKDNIQESEAYFRITATNAEFATQQGAKINTRYKDNEKLKIAFIGNKDGNQEDDNLIYIVVNGVLERASLYDSSDKMYALAGLTIGDPNGLCKVRLKSIRLYSRAISVDEAFNNFVVDSDDVQGMYEKNNVIKAGTTKEIGFDEVANKLPVMIFTGDMNELVTEGQTTKTTSGKWYNFDVEYINRQEPERNFVAFNCRMKLQGTSSLGYPRKNFKLNTKDKNFDKDVYAASNFELDPTSEIGNLQLRNKVTKERIDFEDFKTGGRYNVNGRCFMLDYEGKALKKGKYRFRADAHKAQKWTLKADFMESSCSHNVGAGRSWNDIFENTPLRTNGDSTYVDLTYKDKALVKGSNRDFIEYDGVDLEGKAKHYKIPYNSQAIKDQKEFVCRTDAQKICHAMGQDDVRTAVDGFPMVCFYRTSHTENQLVFLGQYNFINDKSSYEVFGFEDIEDPNDEETMIYDASKVEVFEGLKNTNPISLFKTIEGFNEINPATELKGWMETYESRYPDQEDAKEDPLLGAALDSGVTALYELSQWLLSTRHESDTEYSGTLDIDDTFARHINDYQYGYTDDTRDNYVYAYGVGLEDNAENRQKKFETEKWEHFDVWKVAGYYVYLMRYGAVDQFVKNTMLFTDGNGKYDDRGDLKYRKWFFINYDNDCLFGLRNNGQLAFHWDLDRQTTDAAADILIDDQVDEQGTNAYAMMGHESTLWNNLERDEEFMRMVRDLDYSMSLYKLDYEHMVEEFDTKQTEKWCERIYNANERYKYIQAAKGIGDMEGRPVDNLWMLQGTRRSHRHWWIANHFNLLDAQWLSGDYKKTYVQVKADIPAGTTIHAVAGTKYYYAWGEDKKIFESNMQRDAGEAIEFKSATDQVQGNPFKIYSFNKMTEMDFSEIAMGAQLGTFEFALGDEITQNMLKKLVIGNPSCVNNSPITTTTWIKLPNLEYLDITNYANIKSVPLSSFRNLHVFKATGTKIGSFEPAEGSIFELVELPNSIGTMVLKNISFKNNVNTDLSYTVNTNLTTLEISNNNKVGLDYYNKLIYPWIRSIEESTQWNNLYRNKELTANNVDWKFNSLDSIRLFKNFSIYGKKLVLSGVIDLRGCGNLSRANIEEIKDIFGPNCFNQNESQLYIITPDSVFIESERAEMVAGQTNIFERIIYPDERAIKDKINLIKYYIVTETNRDKSQAGPDEQIFEDVVGNKKYLVINNPASVRYGLSLENTTNGEGQQIGILRCDEVVLNTDTTFKVLVYMNVMGTDVDKVSVMDFTVKDPTYASSATIDGVKSLYSNKEYHFTLFPLTSNGIAPIGSYEVTWNLTGDAVSKYVSDYGVDPNNQLRFNIITNSDQPDSVEISSQMTISATISNYNGSLVSATFNVLVLNENVIMTSDSNPVAMNILYNAVVDGHRLASNANAMTKAEAEAVTDIATFFKDVNSQFSFFEFRYFTGVTSLAASAFQNSNITEIVLPDNLTEFGAYCFDGCSSLRGVYTADETQNSTEIVYTPTLPDGTTTINTGMFRGCRAMTEFIMPDTVTVVKDYAFGDTGFYQALLKSTEVESESGVLRVSNNLASIEGSAFETEKWTPETTTNKLRTLEVPAAFRISPVHEEFLGKYYESFYVAEDNPSIKSINGVLYDEDEQTFLRYPPKREYVSDFDTTPAMVISQYAFFAVENLDTLIFSSNVTSIGTGACRDSKVKYVNLATTSISELKYDTFMNCTELQTVILPTEGTLQKIGKRMFYNCPKLENINIPEGVKEFECDTLSNTYTFVGCNALSGMVFPSTVEKLGINTLYRCPNLKKVVFPTKYDFTTVWKYHSQNNNLVTEDADGIVVNSNIPYSIVNECPLLEDVTLPVMSYNKEDEEGNISSVSINEIMLNQRWVKKLSAPTAITSTSGFYIIDVNSRGNIKGFKLPAEDNGADYVSIDGILYTSDRKKVVLAPCNINSATLDDAVETIGEYAFEGSAVEILSFGPNIRTCEEAAFKNCGKLKTSNIVNSLTSIGKYAFNGVGFETVEIGSNIGGLPQYAFYMCPNIETIVFNGFTGGIGRFGFAGCPSVKKIIVSGERAPQLEKIWNGSTEVEGWFAFDGIGASVYGDKEVLVSVGTSDSYTRVPDTASTPTTYNRAEEVSWNRLFTAYGFTLKEEIPLTGVCDVALYVNGNPYTSIVYADSSLGHLIGLNDEVYSSTFNDGYLFELNGLYDGEVISIYSDGGKANLLGTFIPRMKKTEYQVGSPNYSLSMAKSRVLSSPSDGEVEMADITMAEYIELTSKVNQMMKIIKNLTK